MGLQARPGAGMMPARLHRPRLAILALHPVQYHAPLYREIAASGAVDLTVLYCARRGNKPQYEEEWDVALLDGYRHHFLLNLGRVGWPQPLSRINPGVVSWLVRERYDVLMIQGYTPVSYTHLRAHETPEHLVCRLLLEKKKQTQSKFNPQAP